MDDELIVETWTILKEYIKDKQSAADHWIGELIDLGVTDETLTTLAAEDKYLAKAVEYNDDTDDTSYYYDDE
tara:strand:+ start:77 stop:292 length:216 start_codon:yes stop_codon:yes gene_type:complete